MRGALFGAREPRRGPDQGSSDAERSPKPASRALCDGNRLHDDSQRVLHIVVRPADPRPGPNAFTCPTTLLAIEARHKTPLRRDGWIPRCEALWFERRMCRRPGQLWRHRSCWLPGLVHRRRRVSFRSSCKRRRADRTERRRPPCPQACTFANRRAGTAGEHSAAGCGHSARGGGLTRATGGDRGQPCPAPPILSNGRNHPRRYSTAKRRD